VTESVRGYATTLGALVAGAVLCLVASGMSWGEAQGSGPAPASVTVTGGELLPAAQAVGLLALAAILAVHATRRWGRRVVGGLVVVAGLTTAVWASAIARELPSRVLQRADVPTGAGDLTSASGHAAGALLAIAGGVLIAASGVAVLVKGPRWPGMGARYARPAPERSAASDARSAWEALDRGEDPTA